MTTEEKLHAAANDVASMIQELRNEIAIRDHLIDLIAEDIEWKETHLTPRTDERILEIISVYRTIRPR